MTPAGAAIGAMGGIVQSALNNQLAFTSAKHMAKINFDYNEQAADNANKRALALWQQTQSPQAVLQNIKAAGLSPGLMLGGVGAGGAATGGHMGAGDAGMAAPQQKLMALEGALLGAQVEKTKAEADNIKKNTESEGIKQEGYRTDNSIKIESLEQAKVFSDKVKEELAMVQNDREISDKTKQDKINEIQSKANQAIYQAQDALIQLGISQRTVDDLITQITSATNEAEAHAELAKMEREVYRTINQMYFPDDENDSKGWNTYRRILRRASEVTGVLGNIFSGAGSVLLGRATGKK